jgi:linoleoyl-CoA desaturase
MKKEKIRFSPQKNPEFSRELREKVEAYFTENKISKFGNYHIALKSALMLAMYAVPYLLMLTGTVTYLPLVFLGWILMGAGVAGIGLVLMHDANHRSVSKRPLVNKIAGKSLYLLGGFPETWRHQHNTMHHGYTNVEGYDEDIDPLEFLRFSPHKKLRKIHRFQFIYAYFAYGLMTIAWITTKDFKQLIRYKREEALPYSNKKYRLLMTDLVISKVLYYAVFLVIPLVFFPIAWYWTLLGFFIMHFVCGFILGIIFQTAHVVSTSDYPLPKEGTIDNNWAIHMLETTADYAPNNRVLTWLVGGLNYQVEHHLFPNISHVHYRKIAPIVRETTEKYNLPYHVNETFAKALGSHTRMLKQLGAA